MRLAPCRTNGTASAVRRGVDPPAAFVRHQHRDERLAAASAAKQWSRSTALRCPPSSLARLQVDPIALRIGDPAESTDTLHVLRLFGHVRSLGAQLREHRIQVADPACSTRLGKPSLSRRTSCSSPAAPHGTARRSAGRRKEPRSWRSRCGPGRWVRLRCRRAIERRSAHGAIPQNRGVAERNANPDLRRATGGLYEGGRNRRSNSQAQRAIPAAVSVHELCGERPAHEVVRGACDARPTTDEKGAADDRARGMS
jgi:hypothetical protein